MTYWPFKVITADGDKPLIQVTFRRQTKNFAPEEISAMVLTKMKHITEAHLGTSVRKAVIAIPAHFTNSQRTATIDAGRIAGFEVLRLITEPTAAAIAYGHEKRCATEDKSLSLILEVGRLMFLFFQLMMGFLK